MGEGEMRLESQIMTDRKKPEFLFEPLDDSEIQTNNRYERQKIKDRFSENMQATVRQLLFPLLNESLEASVAEDLGYPAEVLAEIRRRILSGEPTSDLITAGELKKLGSEIEKKVESQQSSGYELVKEQLKAVRQIELEKASEVAEAQEEKYTDELTGSLSKEGIERSFGTMVSNPEELKDDERIIFVSFDIDEFKKINGLFGHDGADEFLKAMTSRLREELRSSDEIGRRSGDEFVILARVDKHSVSSYLNKIKEILKPPYTVKVREETGDYKEYEHELSVTGGVAIISKKDLTSDDKKVKEFGYWSNISDMAAGYAKIHQKGEFITYSRDLNDIIFRMNEQELEGFAGAVVEQDTKRDRNDLQLYVDAADLKGDTQMSDLYKTKLKMLEERKKGLVQEKLVEFKILRLKEERGELTEGLSSSSD